MYRYACSIADGKTVILTGGYGGNGGAISRVTRYGETGRSEDMPPLQMARTNHGCAKYSGDTGDTVYQYHLRSGCIV